jgi:cell division protein FtsZ
LTAKNPATDTAFRYSWHTNLAETTTPLDRYRIAVIGIGEAGNRLITNLSKAGLTGAKFVRLHSQTQKTRESSTDINPQSDDLKRTLSEFDVVFLAAGLNGWKKKGAARTVADNVRSKGSITVGVITVPVGLQNKYDGTLTEVRNHCDTTLIVETDKLHGIVPNPSEGEVNRIADQITANTLKGMIEAITIPSLISYDWSDFKTIMRHGGIANVGIGESDTPNRVQEAVRNALTSPSLILDHWEPAGALVHVTGDNHMTIEEANRVGETVTEMMGPNTTVIWGARINPEQQRKLKVTLVITRRDSKKTQKFLEKTAPHLFNMEPESEQERVLNLDLGLYQMDA